MGHKAATIIFVFLLASLAVPPFGLEAQEADAATSVSGTPLNHFAGGSVSLQLSSLRPSASFPWRLSAQGRALASGSLRSDSAGKASLPFEMPPLKAGATLKAELAVGDGPELKIPLLFHSKEPLKAVSENSPEIGILAPAGEDCSRLCRLVEFSGFKPILVDSPSAFKGMALIAAGLDFENAAALEELLKLCGKGVPAIAVPPLGGAASFKPDSFESMLFSHSLPDAFDASWGSDLDFLQGSASAFRLSQDGSSVLLEAVSGRKGGSGFRCCELRRPGSERLMLLGWDLAGLSKKSPVPSLLLKRFIDMSSNKKEEGSGK